MPKRSKLISDYSALLGAIKEPTKRSEILGKLKTDFPNVIKSARNISDLFLYLTTEEKTQFYNQFKKEIFAVVSTIADLYEIGFLLSTDQTKELYAHLKAQDNHQASTVEGYNQLFRSVKDAKLRAGIVKELDSKFPRLIKSASDVYQLFFELEDEEKAKLYNQFKKEIFAVVSTIADLNAFGFLLSAEQTKELYAHLKAQGNHHASTVEGYAQLFRSVKDAKLRAEIVEELETGTKFSTVIKSVRDLERLFTYLKREEITQLYNRAKKEIFAVISTKANLNEIAFLLSADQSKELYAHLKEQGNHQASTVEDYRQLLRSIKDPVLHAEIVGELAIKFPKLIKSARDVRDLLCYLSPEERTQFYNQFKNEIFRLTPTIQDKDVISFLLTPEQAEELFYEHNNPTEERTVRSQELEFNIKVNLLAQKKNEFRDKPELQAAFNAAHDLHMALTKAGEIYFSTPSTKESYKLFKSTCEDKIREARTVLDHHRGWTKILLNILAIVATAGLCYAIAAGINVAVKGKLTFFSTDSSLKIDEIEESIHRAAPAAKN